MKWLKKFNKNLLEKGLNLSAKTTYQRYCLHSKLNSSVTRNYAKVSAKEPILINVNDAKAKGIETGDVARVFNETG